GAAADLQCPSGRDSARLDYPDQHVIGGAGIPRQRFSRCVAVVPGGMRHAGIVARITRSESTGLYNVVPLLVRWSTAGGEASEDPNRDLLDRVVAVPQSVPLGAVGLRPTGKIGRTRADGQGAWFVHARDQLPPLPAVTVAIADEARLLPAAAAHAHV